MFAAFVFIGGVIVGMGATLLIGAFITYEDSEEYEFDLEWEPEEEEVEEQVTNQEVR